MKVKSYKLSNAQKRAYKKLTHKWQSANDIKEKIEPLVALVKKGYIESESLPDISRKYNHYYLETCLGFRLKDKYNQ